MSQSHRSRHLPRRGKILLSRARRRTLNFSPISSGSFWERILEVIEGESLHFNTAGKIDRENMYRRQANVVLTNMYVLVLTYYFERSLFHFSAVLSPPKTQWLHTAACYLSHLMGGVGSWVCPYFVGSIITWRLTWAAASKKAHCNDWVLI